MRASEVLVALDLDAANLLYDPGHLQGSFSVLCHQLHFKHLVRLGFWFALVPPVALFVPPVGLKLGLDGREGLVSSEAKL